MESAPKYIISALLYGEDCSSLLKKFMSELAGMMDVT